MKEVLTDLFIGSDIYLFGVFKASNSTSCP